MYLPSRDFYRINSIERLLVYILLAVFILASYLLILSSNKKKDRQEKISAFGCKEPPRYPVRDPIFGIDVGYSAIRAVKRQTFLRESREQYEKYGHTHSSRFTTYPVIQTIEPENIKTVLSTNFKDFEIGTPRRRAFAPILANSILVADGPEWEHSRAFLKPSFNRSQVGDLATLEFHVKHLLDALPKDGSTVDLAELFFRYTADVTTDFMFGQSIMSLPKPDAFGGELTKSCRDVQMLAEGRFRLGIFADWVPQPAAYRSVRVVHDYMNSHVERAIQHRQDRNRQGDEDGEGVGRYIFMNELAKQTEDRLVLRDQLGGIFFAGRDTTAALLSNLFFVLARDPMAWNRLRGEIDSLGGKNPSLDELKQLKYLGYCLNETLRLYPIVQGTSRVATKDVVLPKGGGHDEQSPVFVAKGTLVVFHLAALHVRKDLWGDDAFDFRPERWEDEKASWKFLPFGGGPRNCIG
ncbi:MAG: hypothetical protein Q9174_004990, partial [Haloplaca sp. 1 TL-2023]